MIGNNSCGAHAQMSGRCDNNVEELEILLYDGTRMTVGWMNDAELDRRILQGGRIGDIYRYLKSLRITLRRRWCRKDIRKSRAGFPGTTWTSYCRAKMAASTLRVHW